MPATLGALRPSDALPVPLQDMSKVLSLGRDLVHVEDIRADIMDAQTEQCVSWCLPATLTASPHPACVQLQLRVRPTGYLRDSALCGRLERWHAPATLCALRPAASQRMYEPCLLVSNRHRCTHCLTAWTTSIVGKVSKWIQLDDSVPAQRRQSEEVRVELITSFVKSITTAHV